MRFFSNQYQLRLSSKKTTRKDKMRTLLVLGCALFVLAVNAEDKQQTKRGLFNLGYGGHSSYNSYEHAPKVITNTVPVPQPYPVHIEKKVPYPVKVPVDRPYPVHVPKPYPVHIEKPVPIKVDRPVPYPVKVPVKVPVIQRVEVPVPKPYPVPVDKPYPVPVPKPYIVVKKVPVYINAQSSHGSFDSYSGHGIESYGHGFSDYASQDYSSGFHGLSSGYEHAYHH